MAFIWGLLFSGAESGVDYHHRGLELRRGYMDSIEVLSSASHTALEMPTPPKQDEGNSWAKACHTSNDSRQKGLPKGALFPLVQVLKTSNLA
eukprot:1438962-Amphidinium_carterae.1